jgi:hypothetical protein
VVDAIMAGRDHGPALRAAVKRLADEGGFPGVGPGRPLTIGEVHEQERTAAARRQAERSHENCRLQAEAQRNLDLVGPHVSPAGGSISRNPDTGQVTITPRTERTCSAGHPAEYVGQKFWTTCGSPVGAPALGESWPEDPAVVECTTSAWLKRA